MPFETREYSNKNMSGNRIVNVAPPISSTDVEIHGHTHNLEDLGAVSQNDVGNPDGIATLNSDGKISINQLPIVTELIILTENEISNKSVSTTYKIAESLPIEIYVISEENYRSPQLLRDVDFFIVENHFTVGWTGKTLDGLLELYDKLFIKYYTDVAE
jgi:hypothetical protein